MSRWITLWRSWMYTSARHSCANHLTTSASEICFRRFLCDLIRACRSPPGQNVITTQSWLVGLSTNESWYEQMCGWRSCCSSFASWNAACRSRLSRGSLIFFITHDRRVVRSRMRKTAPKEPPRALTSS